MADWRCLSLCEEATGSQLQPAKRRCHVIYLNFFFFGLICKKWQIWIFIYFLMFNSYQVKKVWGKENANRGLWCRKIEYPPSISS